MYLQQSQILRQWDMGNRAKAKTSALMPIVNGLAYPLNGLAYPLSLQAGFVSKPTLCVV